MRMQTKKTTSKRGKKSGSRSPSLIFFLFFRPTMTTETQGPSSSSCLPNGAPDSLVMQDALLRLLSGQRAPSEVRMVYFFRTA